MSVPNTELKPNININSNIYIRKNKLLNDKDYTSRIVGPKKLKKIKDNYSGLLRRIPLTEIQKQIESESATCSLSSNQEKSFGPVKKGNDIVWSCRCETAQCKYYDECISRGFTKRIVRKTKNKFETSKLTNDEDFKRKLKDDFGIEIEQDGEIYFEKDKQASIETEVSVVKETAPTEVPNALIDNVINITEPTCIINSPIDSHILLNSGPGTGKTYTIIQRLIYILSNDLCPADEIYILCYTRSAKKIIEDKIEESISNGILSPSASNICILTFDSYATYFLLAMKEQGEITEDFSNYDYNKRIKLFNEYICEEDFENISYFIVDEIQDLVNDRAEMVIKIIKYLSCGFLLAGDRCQSIYDYEADQDATFDSVKFYTQLNSLLPDDTLKYEISVNRRQSESLSTESTKMREVLLNDSIEGQNRYAQAVMKKYSANIAIEKYIKSITNEPKVSTAILCRSNGEAEYISSLLCKQHIKHNLNRGVNNSSPLPRWIADIFWDYCKNEISKNDFIERFTFRCDTKLDPDKVWNTFCKLSESDNLQIINIEKLITALQLQNNFPVELLEETPLLTVSTIHKAKGSEFDKVILIDSDIDVSVTTAEEARIRYVALTRPKTELLAMKKRKFFYKRISSGRTIQTGIKGNYNFKNTFCSKIAIGFSDDIDCKSFVSGDFDSAFSLQEYIVNNVKQFDKAVAERLPSTNQFEIIHNGKRIGLLSDKMITDLTSGINATAFRYNLPNKLENIYIRNITTEILKVFDSSIPAEYRKSKFCFGIQLTGLAKLNFEKR